MKSMRYFILLLLFSTTVLALTTRTVNAFPASNFSQQNGDWYDNYGIDRNFAGNLGELPGFLPNIESESLGVNKELAYSIGQQFLQEYPDKVDRAGAILKYVQTWTYYCSDSDFKSMNGVPQDEWCQNADEFAHAFNQTTGVTAPGDCDCMATLCGTIYAAAGFDTAVVDCTDHEAVLIWLPECSNANDYWDLNDGRGQGWIWVEATGSSNPLGWTPPDFEDGQWTAYQINSAPQYTSLTPVPQQTSASSDSDTLYIALFVIFAIIMGLIRRGTQGHFLSPLAR